MMTASLVKHFFKKILKNKVIAKIPPENTKGSTGISGCRYEALMRKSLLILFR